MKQKLLPLLLFLLTTVAASARNGYDEVFFSDHSFYLKDRNWAINLADLEVDDKWEALSGTAKWEYATRTLTLTEVWLKRAKSPFSSGYKTGMWIEASKKINIVIKGECTITTTSGSSLITYGDVALTGDGSLYLGGSIAGIEWGTSGTELTVDGPAITIWGGCSKAQLRGTNDKTCSLNIQSGSIKFEKTCGGTPDAYAIAQVHSLTKAVDIDVKTPHAGYFSSSMGMLCNLDGTPVKGTEAYIGKVKDYGFYILNTRVNECNYDELNKRLKNSLKGGTISYSPSGNTLTLTNVTLYNSFNANTIENVSNDGLMILLKGNSTFTFDDSGRERTIIRALENTSIRGRERESSGLKCSESYGGIFVAGGKTLTVKGDDNNLTLTVPYIAGGSTGATLITDSKVTINANGSSAGTIRSIRFQKKMALLPENNKTCFIWNRTDGGSPGVYADRSTYYKGALTLKSYDLISHYDVRIGEDYIHSANRNHFVSDIVTKGYLSWDDNTRTLTLHGATIDENTGGRTIYIGDNKDATIVVEGKSAVNCKCDNPTHHVLYSTESININEATGTTGNSLTITSRNESNNVAEMFVSGKLTVNCDFDVPGIFLRSLEVDNHNLNISHVLYDYYNNSYSVRTVLEGAVVASSKESPAYYDPWESAVITDNGSVRFAKSTDDDRIRGISFCGINIHKYNKDYVWTKQLKSGSVKYDSNNRVWTLNNVNITNYTVHHTFSLANVNAGLLVNGKNSIHCSKPECRSFYLESGATLVMMCPTVADTVIHTLAVTGTNSKKENAGSIFIGENCALSKQVYSSMLSVTVPSIEGAYADKSQFIVSAPYFTVTGNKTGTVRTVECIVNEKAELYNTASTPREITANGVFSNGSFCTEEVKFVKKGDSYIKVNRISLDKQELTFTKKRDTAQLTATITPADATNQTIVWRSGNSDVAVVDVNGKVTAVGNGVTEIFAYSSDGMVTYQDFGGIMTNVCKVTVNIPDPTSITLDRTSYTFKDESVTAVFVRATLAPDNADYDNIVWKSSDSTIAYIAFGGSRHEAQVRRTDRDGTCTITARTPNGLTATCNITVLLHPTYVEEINFDVADEVHLKTIGESFKITPTILPADATDKTIRWWSNTQDNVVVDQNGVVTAKNYGGSVVFCFAEDGSGVYKRINVYVDRPPVLATGIDIDPKFPNTFYNIGDQLLLKATVTPSNTTNKTVRWESDDETVATVDETGVATIVGWGSCHVTASTTDGSNLTSEVCYIDAQDPSTIIEPVPGYGLSFEKDEVTLIKGESMTVTINLEPGNYNGSLDYWPVGDVSRFNDILTYVSANNYDQETNRHFLTLSSDPFIGQTGTVQLVVYMPDADIDKDKLIELGLGADYVPADTITVHVIDPIVFTAKSVEGIDVTYHVPTLDSGECEVFADYDEMGGQWDPDLLDYPCTPAVPVTASGKLTVPSKVTDSSTGKSYWVTSVSDHAFMQCSQITEIEFSEGITTIERMACHRQMYALQKVTLPSSITSLGQQCFAGHWMDYSEEKGFNGFGNLREVYIKSFMPPLGEYMDYGDGNGEYMPIGDTGVFDMIAQDAVLYVPVGAKENYSCYPWITETVSDGYGDSYEMQGWFSRIEESDFIPAEEPEKADVNGDGAVDVADISSVISVMAGAVGDSAIVRKADVNGDGAVDVADISSVITRMAELARMILR